MNVLSIGNSFSEDAQRYLHQIAKVDNYILNAFNLFISGCSISLHYRNMLSEKKAYELQINGESTGFCVSLKEALLNRDWDVVTIQQASLKSAKYETYQPYLNVLVDYIRNFVPKAKVAIHQTRAYEQGSAMLNKNLGYKEHTEMFYDVKNAYQKALEDTKADLIIPSGEVFQKLIANGIEKVHRDTFHASYGLGRYTLALLWYRILTGKDIQYNSFNDFDEEISKREIDIAKQSVTEVCEIYGR